MLSDQKQVHMKNIISSFGRNSFCGIMSSSIVVICTASLACVATVVVIVMMAVNNPKKPSNERNCCLSNCTQKSDGDGYYYEALFCLCDDNSTGCDTFRTWNKCSATEKCYVDPEVNKILGSVDMYQSFAPILWITLFLLIFSGFLALFNCPIFVGWIIWERCRPASYTKI